MIFAPTLSRQERAVVGRLQVLGLDGERCIKPRHDFRDELRHRLVTEAGARTGSGEGLTLAGC